ncbi:MAG TPA: SO_0444 family Cu/Zn efflux transporter [Sedimentisphaerales bacterium]|nr:SO_0444 family Cu/Zn efflux transporter [Sedimentisphaerales bacterium]
MLEFIESLIVHFWDTMAEMSPFLLFGFFVAGVLSVLVSRTLVERHLGGRGPWPLIKASLFGVPLPLCSCGVIPVAMSLHKHGASKGSTISFLLSTPQTGVDSIFVTLSLLGPVFAIFRPIAAFITGIVGGLLIELFEPRYKGQQAQEKCTDECCSEHAKKGKIQRIFKYGFVTLPRDIGKAMLLGLVIAAIISVFVPADFFADYLGTGIFAMIVMMFLGIPVYVCATASVPVAAALILKGLTPGAALVFLMTGPATNAAAFVTIWKALGRRTALLYLAAVAGCAIAAGIVLDYIIGAGEFETIAECTWMLPPLAKNISAIILIAVLVYAVIAKPRSNHTDEE